MGIVGFWHRLGPAVAVGFLVCCACDRPPDPPTGSAPATSGELAARIAEQWKPALAGTGTATVDRLIERETPGCFRASPGADSERWAEQVRRTVVESMGLDLDRQATGARQRTVARDGYSVDVIRLETFPGIFMPANVYVPDAAGPRGAPLVVSPTGCGSGVGSAHVQTRAANLALRGMAVLVTEGFCDNGARSALSDSNPHVGYARQLLGLPGDLTVYLQELIAALGWVVRSYPVVDAGRVGVAGYSYGGQMALLLAVVDPRIKSVSVPATGIGTSCESFRLTSDIWLEESPRHGTDFVWSAPPELPLLPVNWRLAMIFPRPFHTTSGRRDWGAHPDDIGPAVDYMKTIYAAAGQPDRVLYRTDGGDHQYGSNRRLDTYTWLDRTLQAGATRFGDEISIVPLDADTLTADITGTRTLAAELADRVERERSRRFASGHPDAEVRDRVTAIAADLFNKEDTPRAGDTPSWEQTVGTVRVRARRFQVEGVPLAVFEFEQGGSAHDRRLVYLPERGTRVELDEVVRLLEKHPHVVSIDFPGIGELKSDRLLLHTFARYYMHDADALPTRTVKLLRDWLVANSPGTWDIAARGWASSFHALLLKHLEPSRVGVVRACGPPEDELGHLADGRKIPDLLLQGGLFSRLTVAELASALEPTAIDLTTGSCP